MTDLRPRTPMVARCSAVLPDAVARKLTGGSAFFSFIALVVMALWFALAAGCDGHDEDGHSHGGEASHGHGDEHAHGGAGHDHGPPTEAVTRWGERTQLFVEFPALVAGRDSAFAAHLTRLQDHGAIDQGAVVVELSGGGQPVERFAAQGPATPGIFRPVVKPVHAGPRQVTLKLESPESSERHELGEFIVFSSQSGARAAAEHEAEGEAKADEGISFLLEQQWQVPFGVVQVGARQMRPNIPAFARLTLPPEAEASVTAARAGRLLTAGDRFPRVGQEVEEGEVLFRLSAAPQEGADRATLELAVEQAQIEVEAAQREVDRLAPLAEQGVVAQRRLDEAGSELSRARASLRSARRRRGSLQASQRVGGRGELVEVPSPISGTIAEIQAASGAWVSQGQMIARVVDRDHLWLNVGVPQAYLGRLGDISGAWFDLENARGVVEVPASALVSVGVEVDPKTRTLPVRFALDNTRRELFAGMTTRAHLVTDQPRLAPAVPVEAVVDDGGTDVVYVQTGGESFERRPVELGIRDGDFIEVRQGVVPGEWVVARGAYAVKLAGASTQQIGHGHAH